MASNYSKCATCAWNTTGSSIDCTSCDSSYYLRSDHKGCVANCWSLKEYKFTGGVFKCASACGVEEPNTIISSDTFTCTASCTANTEFLFEKACHSCSNILIQNSDMSRCDECSAKNICTKCLNAAHIIKADKSGCIEYCPDE